MKQVGKVDDSVRTIMRLIGLLTPFALGLYGYMVYIGYAPGEHFLNIQFFMLLISMWTLYGVWQYVSPASSGARKLQSFIIYHLFGILFLLFVSGFSTFVISMWAILALITWICYGVYGYIFSIATLVLSASIDLTLHPATLLDSSVLFLNIIGVIFISGSVALIEHARQQGKLKHPATDTIHQAEDHQRLVTIINNLADAVLVTNAKGTIELFNAASLNLLDTNADIKNKSVDMVLATRTAEGNTVKVSNELSKAKHVVIDDSLRIGPADDPIRLELTYAPIRGSYKTGIKTHGSEGYIIIARDVTKEKSLEEERDEFISVVSHELRTPVTVAEGSISNAQLFVERGKGTKDNLASALSQAHEQVVFLAGMINDLSTLSRAERGVAAENEAIDVKSFVHDIYNEFLPQAQKQKLHFNLEAASQLGTVMTSRLYLHELMQNFITNAIKYTKKGSVTLSVRNIDGIIEFKVTDTGIGISKSDQAKIFNKFYRSEDYRTRETNGTGLGLYVAYKLAKKLKTTIDVSSRLNHGSSFTIKLPEHKDI